MKDLEERIQNLEETMSFQEETIDSLNEVVISQQNQIDTLILEIEKIQGALTTIGGDQGPQIPDPPPPHY